MEDVQKARAEGQRGSRSEVGDDIKVEEQLFEELVLDTGDLQAGPDHADHQDQEVAGGSHRAVGGRVKR